jgi:hypothetical protein
MMRGGGKEHRKQQSLGFGGGVRGRREEKEEERDHIDRLSFSLSFFLSFTRFWEYDSGNYKVPDLNFLPSLLLLLGEKRLFFHSIQK